MRRQGNSAIGEVHNKLLILKEENQRLRQNHVSIKEVEQLLEENKSMKFELQILRNEPLDTSFRDIPSKFDINILSKNASEQSSQL